MPHVTPMSSSSKPRKSRIATSVASMMHTNAVYFPNTRIYNGDTPASLNYGCISHVYYAYAHVTRDGAVVLSDEWADAQAPIDGVQGGIGSLMHIKQLHPHLQVVLSIGGPGCVETFPMVASNAAARDNFARSAKGLVDASGMDGIDITWEYPCDKQQGQNFLALLAAVRIYLPEDQYIVTAALPPNKAVLQLLDLPRVAEYVDLLNLTTYDLQGPSISPKSGHHAQLYAMSKDEPSASTAIQWLLGTGFPAKKILLGIPVFGRGFAGVAGPGHKNRGPGGGSPDGLVEYAALPLKGMKETVDKKAVAAQAVSADVGFVTYDNPDTVKLKAGFCRQKGLGGLFYWSGPMDSKDQTRSLVAAGFRALHTS